MKAAGLCALLLSAPQTDPFCAPVVFVSSPAIDRWQSIIAQAAGRFDVPQDWIRAVMHEESRGLTILNGAPITSRAGAMGLMQLMPRTWSDLRARYSLGNDPFDPRDNILAGAAYLRELFDRYGYPNLFAAYHAGPGRIDAGLANEKLLPEATKVYLESIVPDAQIESISTEKSAENRMKSRPNPLFFLRIETENSSLQSNNSVPQLERLSRDEPGLFVPLTPRTSGPSR